MTPKNPVSTESPKPMMLPLSVNPYGDVLGLVKDEQGIRPVSLHRIEEGKPIYGDHVRVIPQEGSPFVELDITRIPGVPSQDVPPRAVAGPPQVTSEAYRMGYDRIFKRSPVGEA